MGKKNTNLFGEVIIALPLKKKDRPRTNPLIPVYGPGPQGMRCGQCEKQYFRLKYPKCSLRPDGAAATDHSSRYEACGQFNPKATP